MPEQEYEEIQNWIEEIHPEVENDEENTEFALECRAIFGE